MFSRLASPRLRLLPLLWVFWLLVGGLLFLLVMLIHGNWGDLRRMLDSLSYLDINDIGILLLYVSPFAVILGSAHYAVLRLRVKRSERKSSNRELWLVPLLTVILSMIPGWLAWQNIHQNRLLADIWNMDSTVYEKLAMDGQYDELVRRMETACERFDKAKQALDGKFQVHDCNHGFSYLFVNLHPTWRSTSRLAPYGVLAFLENTRYDQSMGSENGGYGPWRPIAEKVSQSQTPILRTLGCFMLVDDYGFAEAAYALADCDPDAIPLIAVASSRGSDPAKCVISIKRVLEYQSSGVYQYIPSPSPEDLDGLLLSNTAKALDAGQIDGTMKARLRTLSWAHKLSPKHQEALGMVVEKP
jgi:hypothetical protein